VDHDLFERLQSHLAWPALLPFPHFDAERIFVRVEAGTPLVEAVFPSALVVASRACVPPLPVCDTLSRFGTFALVPARSSLDRGTVVVGERCPCGFRTLNRFAEQLTRRSPFAGDVDFVLDRSGDMSRSSTSCVWLAIRTSRSYLSATNVRLEHIRILDRACERLCGPLPMRGSFTKGASSPGVPLPACQWTTRDLAER
jgi:hypothetical protein